jgi:triosephosphate isomerase (TIM)
MRPYIVGNWKMNGSLADLPEARAIASHAKKNSSVDVALCVPATLIAAISSDIPLTPIGAQDCHQTHSGAFTGSLSANMLADAGAKITLVGHSERREALGEDDALVQSKAQAALAAWLGVIVCVGEPRKIREAGKAQDFVLQQIALSLPDMDAAGLAKGQLSVAYEPIWAIGTGLVPTLEDVAAMHMAIYTALTHRYGPAAACVRLLYGGSVNAQNAGALLSIAHVDGALVGGASLKAQSFNAIISAAAALDIIAPKD